MGTPQSPHTRNGGSAASDTAAATQSTTDATTYEVSHERARTTRHDAEDTSSYVEVQSSTMDRLVQVLDEAETSLGIIEIRLGELVKEVGSLADEQHQTHMELESVGCISGALDAIADVCRGEPR